MNRVYKEGLNVYDASIETIQGLYNTLPLEVLMMKNTYALFN
jgi:hypothetical protein